MDLVVEQVVTDEHLQYLEILLLVVAVVQDIIMVVIKEDKEDQVVEAVVLIVQLQLQTEVKQEQAILLQ